MKKLLLIILIVITVGATSLAQTVWNFSNAPFGATGAAGGTAVIDLKANYSSPDGLTIGTDGTVLWTGLTANAKTIDGTAYTYRLQTGGGGAPAAGSKIPTTRYLKFRVSGNSSIKVGVGSSSSGTARTIIIVNSDQTYLDSITGVDAVQTYSYNYTGSSNTIYLYSRASGINYYYLSATNVVTGISSVFADNQISYNGTEVTNSNSVKLALYDALGKKLLTTTSNINTSKLSKGFYIVRAEGTNDALKFIK